MKTKTLFDAYKICRDMMFTALVCRELGNVGIGIQDDHWSLEYQRYSRLARKLDDELTRRLKNNERLQ